MEKDGHEYGDYEKYDKNRVDLKIVKGEDDTGDDVFLKKYQNMLRSLNTTDGDTVRENDDLSMSDAVENYSNPKTDPGAAYNHNKDSFDFHDQIQHVQNEQRLFK